MVNPYASKVAGLSMDELRRLGKVLKEGECMMPGLVKAPKITHLVDGSGLECYYWATFVPRQLAQAVRVRIREIGTHACTYLGSLEEHTFTREKVRKKRVR